MKNLANWTDVYTRHLLAVVSDPANGYCYGPEMVPSTVAKMRTAFENGSYNKDGETIKRTCKELKIKYTYAAINSYLKGD